MNTQPILDSDLCAYADRQLAPERAALVEAAITRDPVLAARVAEIRAQNAALRDGLDPMLAERIPERLLDAARVPGPATAPRAPSPRWFLPVFAAAASLVLGVALGWFVRDAMIEQGGTPTTFAREAAFSHAMYTAEQRRPVEVWAAEEKSLVTWLGRRTGHTVRAPDLTSVGYSLVGGRLVAGNARPTGLFMYENADRQRLTLQWRKQLPGIGETAFRYSMENGIGVFYWIDDDCGYALSGNVDRSQLLAVARIIYGQLAAPDAAAPK
jgi:anti-sigma factor RsiW